MNTPTRHIREEANIIERDFKNNLTKYGAVEIHLKQEVLLLSIVDNWSFSLRQRD
jgi:hypothetical protein